MTAMDLDALLEGEGVVGDLGIGFEELDAGRIVATMPVDRRHRTPMGFLHGEVSAVLAETVATVGAWLSCPEGKTAFGSEINASHLRPKKEGKLTAVGNPLHRGRASQVWQVEIRDEDGKVVCVSRCSLAVVDL